MKKVSLQLLFGTTLFFGCGEDIVSKRNLADSEGLTRKIHGIFCPEG